ncbi:MAG: EamA family transporter RarD [Anaerolineales bacterium]|nr:EamA family transporter RarD [Anaerolineales bacterium]
MSKGTWYGVGAYVMWGLFPVYWKLLDHVPALQLIGHRIVWSCLILTGVILLSRQLKAFLELTRTPYILRIYTLAALLIGVNWLVYIWAVNSDFIIETSLGYFINPLISILLGVIFLREHLRLGQWIPIGLAFIGVLYLTFTYGRLPWIALTLAFTFGLYGLVKKTAPLGALYGLTLETGLLFLPALFYLIYSNSIGQGAFLHSGTVSDFLMAGAGVMTTLPLLMFAYAVQQMPLSLMGILQYINPTMQFLLGLLVYREAFTVSKLIGFGLVWLALIILGVEGVLTRRKQGTQIAKA